MTTDASHSAAPTDSAQSRVSQNIVQLLAYRGASRAALARHLHLDPAAVSRRALGGVTWNLEEVQSAAVFLQVPWPWLTEPLPDLMRKVTTGSVRGPDGGLATGEYRGRRRVSRAYGEVRSLVTRPRVAVPAPVPLAA